MLVEFTIKRRSTQPPVRDLRVAINPKAVAYVLPIQDSGTCIVPIAMHPDDPSVLVQEAYGTVVEKLNDAL
jgi:hypothetical protein